MPPRLYERIVAHPRVGPLKPTWTRSRHTTTPLRLFAQEALLQRPGTRTYRVRGAEHIPVAVRHLTPDLLTLDEVFVQRSYAEPPPVTAAIDGLGRPPRVLDLGANIGLAAAWFARRWPGAEIVCVEPDPANLQSLRVPAAAAGWRVVEAAAAAEPGTLEFSAGAFAASQAEPGGGIVVEAIDVFALATELQPDLIKSDMEGGEWALLCDPRLSGLSARAIVMEYHPHLCPAPEDPRAEAFARLRAAGYEVADAAGVEGTPEGVGTLWAWR